MLIFPYKADVELQRLPLLTLLVCIVCLWVFAHQWRSESAYETAVERYCTQLSTDEGLVMRYLDTPKDTRLCDVLIHIRKAPDSQAAIEELANNSRPTPFYADRAASVNYIRGVLSASSQRFKHDVPNNLTDRLHFDPKQATLWSSITSAFSHGSVEHVVFNLIFFFAFAASVEVITGSVFYVVLFVLCAVGSDYAYAYSVRDEEVMLPTIGLSGVVMAMMAFLATIKPMLNIRCFFWFLLFIRKFSVPALALAALYIGENIYDYAHRDPNSNVNYMAHISGAAIGAGMGLLYRWRKAEYLNSLG
jgi:membrane associated rhomboid family serine protease